MVNEEVHLHPIPLSAAGASLPGRVVTWASRNPGIATVSALGAVTGVSVGQTTVIVASEGIAAEVPVSVIPAVGELDVSVTKFGHAADPEDFQLLVNGQPLDDPLDTFGRRLIVLPVGMHTASLEDLDDHCEIVGEQSRIVFVYPRQRQALTFNVACLLTGQLVVTTQTTGQRSVSDPYRVTLDGGDGVFIDPDGELRFDLHPGTYQVALSTEDPRCLVADAMQAATVLESSTLTIQFQVRCYADPPGLAGEKLVVSYNATSGSGLYAIDPDGARRFNIEGDPSGAGDPAISADGRRLAFRRFTPDGSHLVVIDVVSGARSVSVGRLNISGLSWAPDGQRLVTGLTSDGSTSLVVLRADGLVERNLGLRDATSLSAHWAPDGRTISVTRNNHAVLLVNPDGSEPRTLKSSTNEYFDGGQWSPDGQTLLVRSYKQWCYYYSWYCYPFDARLMVLDAATGREIRSVKVPDDAIGFVWGGTSEEVYFAQAGDVFRSRFDAFAPVNVTRSPEHEWSVQWGRFESGASSAARTTRPSRIRK